MAPMVISPGNKHHGTRSIDAVSSTPLGSTRATSTTVDYTLPSSQGECASEDKRRAERHLHREANKVHSLDLSGAAEEIIFAMTNVTTKVTTTSRYTAQLVQKLELRVWAPAVNCKFSLACSSELRVQVQFSTGLRPVLPVQVRAHPKNPVRR